ncbi:hypothetical protein H6F75_16020 [Nodosilinea sp. FACHB-131]|uniref:hypothetical protein n=1 Tax=Cyanophyceae TaxID=3028117 RepID=UPI0016843CEF|nr:hypothetical protein [Nodosilinea sp. FACHB-131]MBD1874995.1 hypothetical protein [Nodosilinea sp. FACHB-131]
MENKNLGNDSQKPLGLESVMRPPTPSQTRQPLGDETLNKMQQEDSSQTSADARVENIDELVREDQDKPDVVRGEFDLLTNRTPD